MVKKAYLFVLMSLLCSYQFAAGMHQRCNDERVSQRTRLALVENGASGDGDSIILIFRTVEEAKQFIASLKKRPDGSKLQCVLLSSDKPQKALMKNKDLQLLSKTIKDIDRLHLILKNVILVAAATCCGIGLKLLYVTALSEDNGAKALAMSLSGLLVAFGSGLAYIGFFFKLPAKQCDLNATVRTESVT